MRKRIFSILLFAALLLTVGCAEDTATESSRAGTGSDESNGSVCGETSSVSSEACIEVTSSEANFEISSEISSETDSETSSESIELPPAPEFTLQDGLRFCPGEGWQETREHVYTSADGVRSVRADFLTLPDPQGITEVLLVNDALQTLPDAIAQTGAEIVTLESVTLDFLGTEHPAVSLVTSKDGKTVWQHQIYLLDGENILLLTACSQNEDTRETLWSYFKEN